MATIVPTIQSNFIDRYIVTWTGLASGDTGEPVSYEGLVPGTIQVLGNFGSGGSINIEGTNDPTLATWDILRGTGGTGGAGSKTLTLTAADLDGILEDPVYVRPNVTAGTGVSLTVILVVRKNQRAG